MSKLKVAYFGTPDFSARFLENVINAIDLPIEVVLVVTQPDKPVGRKQLLTPSPIKQVARKYNFDLFDNPLSSLSPQLLNIDLVLLYAYGDIINLDLLKAPKYGFWNIHPSLLPLYRGASPIAYPLILGETKTGVTLMQMDEELDHGPIIAQKTYDISQTDTRADLETKLTDLGFELFKEMITRMSKEQINSVPQDDSSATYTRKLTKQDGHIPLSVLKKALNNELLTRGELPNIFTNFFSENPHYTKYEILSAKYVVHNMFRGLNPWPGIWTTMAIDGVEKRLKITDASLKNDLFSIDKVQLEGKQEIPFNQFNKTHQIL